MANDKLIKKIFDEEGGKELLVKFAEMLETLYDQLDNKSNSRDEDMFIKGQIYFAKGILEDLGQIKKL